MSSGGPGNAVDARGGVDDAGERASGPVGMGSSGESGESRRAGDRFKRVGRERGDSRASDAPLVDVLVARSLPLL